jgi:hypothetical protein
MLLADAAQALRPGGRLVLGFRDLSRVTARFILVRGDQARVLTCALEEQGDFLVVHDLLHERDESAAVWKLAVSSYRKLRLSPDDVSADAVAAGLEVVALGAEQGLVTLVAGPAREA